MKAEKIIEVSKDAYNRYKPNITKEQKTAKNMFELGYQAALIEHSKMIEELQHHKDTTIGLYAIDFNPKELIQRFVDSQSDATRLYVEDVEMINFGKSELYTVLNMTTTFSVPNTKNAYPGYGLTLPEPIPIPTNSRVKVQLDYPAVSANLTPYFTALMKGTLQRRLI